MRPLGGRGRQLFGATKTHGNSCFPHHKTLESKKKTRSTNQKWLSGENRKNKRVMVFKEITVEIIIFFF